MATPLHCLTGRIEQSCAIGGNQMAGVLVTSIAALCCDHCLRPLLFLLHPCGHAINMCSSPHQQLLPLRISSSQLSEARPARFCSILTAYNHHILVPSLLISLHYGQLLYTYNNIHYSISLALLHLYLHLFKPRSTT